MAGSGFTDEDRLSLIAQLRRFEGPPPDFWPLFLKAACELIGASRATLVFRISQPTEDGQGVMDRWRALASHPKGGAQIPDVGLLDRALAEGLAREDIRLAFSVGGEDTGSGVVVLEGTEDMIALPAGALADLLSVLPQNWQAEREVQVLKKRLKGLAGALDLALIVGGQQKFTAAAFAACNELAARFGCDRVSLGWQDDSVLRLRAMSQADKFDSRSSLVRQAETAMEETYDQDEILVFPVQDNPDAIVREHEEYARQATVRHLCSVPIRARKKPQGVWLLERSSSPFNEEELSLLRVMADQAGPRLADMRQRDRAWPVRVWHGLKEKASGILGPKHTGPKLLGAAAALLILFLLVGRLPYSVEAPATVRSGHVVFVTAPFDGFIDEVFYEVGDTVAEDTTLVTFDTRELLVQQAAELANLNRYNKEVESARAKNALSDMRVAEAQAEQAKAVLDRTQFHLDQAVIKAPIDGVIVEGDLRKRLGAPFSQGDVLFQQARLDELYVQIEVPENEIHEVLDRTEARMLFAAQPDVTYPLAIQRVQPAGNSTPSGVVFQMRAISNEDVPDWWRPGMSGTVRIKAGWRNAGWILTHRTTDWLRKQLWW